jgi:RimJ/RimL family protein N-acetyltransferase
MGQYALAGAASLGLDSIIAYTRVDNAASRHVMDKLGLHYEREFEHVELPHVLYRKALAV